MYDYLWHGRSAAESQEVREVYVRERFAAMLDIAGINVPRGPLDPFIDYVTQMFAQLAEPGASTAGQH